MDLANNIKLTAGAIESYLDGHPTSETFMQVINIKKIPNSNTSNNVVEKYRLQVSDSIHFQPCLLVSSLSEKVSSGHIDRYCIIKIEEMIPTNIQGRKILLIKNLTVSQFGCTISQIIGNPTSLELRKAHSDSILSKPMQSSIHESVRSSEPSCSKADVFPDCSDSSDFTANLSSNQGRVSLITILNPYNSNWTICARVTAKPPIRKWSNSKGEGKVFSFELTDSSAIIRVTAFNEFATEYDRRIVLNKVYFLSKADMKPTNKKFCGNSNHDFELYINSSTELEECFSSTIDIPLVTYNFKIIDEIRLLPKDSQIDFIGVCVEICDLVDFLLRSKGTQLQKRELILADRTRKKINCTLWGTDALNFNICGNPIILIRSARVSDFNTCSLTVGTNSSLVIDPDISIAKELKAWFNTEGTSITLESVSTKAMGFAEVLGFSSITSAISSVNDNRSGEFFTFRAIISLFKKDREIFYKSCPSDGCQKKVFKDEFTTLYRCEKCNLDFPNYVYRYMISMEIHDYSGSIWVTCFNESETIFGISAEEMGRNFEVDGKQVVDAHCDDKMFTTYYFKTKLKQERYNDEYRLKAIILGVTTTNTVIQDCKILLKKIQSFCVGL